MRHGVSPGVFLEYFLSISAEIPKITEIVFFEYFWGIPYFTECSDRAECKPKPPKTGLLLRKLILGSLEDRNMWGIRCRMN